MTTMASVARPAAPIQSGTSLSSVSSQSRMLAVLPPVLPDRSNDLLDETARSHLSNARTGQRCPASRLHGDHTPDGDIPFVRRARFLAVVAVVVRARWCARASGVVESEGCKPAMGTRDLPDKPRKLIGHCLVRLVSQLGWLTVLKDVLYELADVRIRDGAPPASMEIGLDALIQPAEPQELQCRAKVGAPRRFCERHGSPKPASRSPTLRYVKR